MTAIFRLSSEMSQGCNVTQFVTKSHSHKTMELVWNSAIDYIAVRLMQMTGSEGLLQCEAKFEVTVFQLLQRCVDSLAVRHCQVVLPVAHLSCVQTQMQV